MEWQQQEPTEKKTNRAIQAMIVAVQARLKKQGTEPPVTSILVEKLEEEVKSMPEEERYEFAMSITVDAMNDSPTYALRARLLACRFFRKRAADEETATYERTTRQKQETAELLCKHEQERDALKHKHAVEKLSSPTSFFTLFLNPRK